MKNLKKNGGITLVALIITIIILLILAGISIQAITNTGIFAQANNAKRESEIASIKEQIVLDIYEKQLEPPVGSITDEQLETILGKYGTVNKEDGTIVGITTGKGYEILLKDIYGGETVAESVPDGAIVTPVNDITTWLKTGEISNQYSYTTIEQVIADSTCIQSLMNNENAMKYLARSTEFADALCASETTMTYLGQSAYVDDTVLNSDLWVNVIRNSSHIEKVFRSVIPSMTGYDTPDGSVTFDIDCYTGYEHWRGFNCDNQYYHSNGVVTGGITYNFSEPRDIYKIMCHVSSDWGGSLFEIYLDDVKVYESSVVTSKRHEVMVNKKSVSKITYKYTNVSAPYLWANGTFLGEKVCVLGR